MTFVLSALLHQTPGTAYGQQIADPKFDATVAKPAYTDKHPEVLFDEAHCNFHTASGRYKPFVDLIKNDGYRVTVNFEKFEKKTLEGFDILVIANAATAKGRASTDPAFTKDECDAVYDWVRAGGALLLIADHAPFGTTAEILANRFGVEMTKGYTSDQANYEKSGNPGWLVFTQENKLLGDHAITNGRADTEKVKRVVSFAGQSLKGPEGSVAFLKLADSAIDRLPPDFKKSVSAAGRANASKRQHIVGPGVDFDKGDANDTPWNRLVHGGEVWHGTTRPCRL
jgi:hypothetical protein